VDAPADDNGATIGVLPTGTLTPSRVRDPNEPGGGNLKRDGDAMRPPHPTGIQSELMERADNTLDGAHATDVGSAPLAAVAERRVRIYPAQSHVSRF
jgi:hypothetical protein